MHNSNKYLQPCQPSFAQGSQTPIFVARFGSLFLLMADIFAWGAQRKGKQHKRRASQLLAESAVPKSEQFNPFVSWLLEMHVLKQLSAVQVQAGAAAAVAGGLLQAQKKRIVFVV